jgi:hypothetical protein
MVEVRRPDRGVPITSEIAIPEVVREQDHHVRATHANLTTTGTYL